MSIIEKLEINPRTRIPRNKDWQILSNGTLIHLEIGYRIDSDRLLERDWIAHMRTKGWCDMNTFIDAYFLALNVRGVKKLTIDIY